MPPLPPLRTVRDPSTLTPAPIGTVATPAPGLSVNGRLAGPANAPIALRVLLTDLLNSGLLLPSDIEPFLAKVQDRLVNLSDKDRAAGALAIHGYLTPFQRDRVLNGASFGLIFGNYRVLDRRGDGSVGIVFEAEHRFLKRKAAIKVLPAEDTMPPQLLERFELEMELLARIDHPHVVRVLDSGRLVSPDPRSQPTLYYAVLEYLSGGDLEKHVYQNGAIPVPQACEWARQLAGGLEAMHASGIIHRDFKPSNVLLTPDRRAKISDFGLARRSGSVSTPRPGIVGSLEFMAPEQAADATTVGPAADIYALGASLFWMLTGQLPYPTAANSREALNNIRTSNPRRLKEIDPTLPDELDKLVAKLLTRNPASRPTATDAMAQLAAFADPSNHPAFTDVTIATETGAVAEQLRFAVAHLEGVLAATAAVGREAGTAVFATLAQVAHLRGEPLGQQRRIQEYVRGMAQKLSRKPDWIMFADPAHLDAVLQAVPARNVGLAGVPDAILHATGNLSKAQQSAMEAHALFGCQILDAILASHGDALPYARIARGIIRSHHEKWDGTGFPDRLARDAIPHAARLVAVAEAYDALRRPQDDDPGFTHDEAIQGLLAESNGFFDPAVMDALAATHEWFAEVYDAIPD